MSCKDCIYYQPAKTADVFYCGFYHHDYYLAEDDESCTHYEEAQE